MTLSKVDLLNAKFSRKLLGYRPEEVDHLLQEVAETLGGLAERNAALKDTVAKLERILGDYRAREETLRDALLTTQQVVEELKEKARDEAERIVADARDEARVITAEAKAQLELIRSEAVALSRRRARLEADLREAIVAHLRLLDSGAAGEEAAESAFTFSEGEA